MEDFKSYDSTRASKEYLAQWMQKNEKDLVVDPNGIHYNFFTSGKKPNGWKRVAKGVKDAKQFRIFRRAGPQDLRRPLVAYKTPETYAVLWYDENDQIVSLEWSNLNDALKLGYKIASGVGGYYLPKEQ